MPRLQPSQLAVGQQGDLLVFNKYTGEDGERLRRSFRHPGCRANRDLLCTSASTMFAANGNRSRLTRVAGMTMGSENLHHTLSSSEIAAVKNSQLFTFRASNPRIHAQAFISEGSTKSALCLGMDSRIKSDYDDLTE